MIYPNIPLNAEEVASLRKLSADEMAIRQFISTVQTQGEQRLSELQMRGREVWGALAEKNGFDPKKVDYVLNEDGDALVAVRVRLLA